MINYFDWLRAISRPSEIDIHYTMKCNIMMTQGPAIVCTGELKKNLTEIVFS